MQVFKVFEKSLNSVKKRRMSLKAVADPVPKLTDAYKTSHLYGGILPREILKSRTTQMRFPAFRAIHTSESQNYLLHFWKARKKLEPISQKQHNFSI